MLTHHYPKRCFELTPVDANGFTPAFQFPNSWFLLWPDIHEMATCGCRLELKYPGTDHSQHYVLSSLARWQFTTKLRKQVIPVEKNSQVTVTKLPPLLQNNSKNKQNKKPTHPCDPNYFPFISFLVVGLFL